MTDQPAAVTLSNDLREYGEKGNGRIQAQVSSFREGLQIYNGVNIVRVRGGQSRLLIMEDYLPVIGEVDGDVDFIGKGFFHTLRSVHGFFCHEHNVFFLLLRETPDRSAEEEIIEETGEGEADSADG
jgi:hypothetical protein